MCQNAVSGEEQHRTEDRRDESRGLVGRVPTSGTSDQMGSDGTSDADEDGDDDTTRVLARHHEFRESADDETD